MQGINNLTTEQILGIYSGKHTSWSELGGPDAKIYPVQREPGDSGRGNLEKHMPGFTTVTSDAKIFYTTPEAAAAIANHRFTIGYLPAAAARQHQLPAIAIDGVFPDEQSVTNRSYPHVLPFYLVTQGPASASARRMIEFLSTEKAHRLIRSWAAVPATD